MHISKISLINYRNFANARFLFSKGVNTVIGENGSGKTNLFRAMRLLLDDNLIRSAYRLDERDFFRGINGWQGHWIIISLEFQELSPNEAVQALFLHGAGNVKAAPLTTATYNLVFRPRADIRQKLAALTAGDKTALEALRKTITIADYETVYTGRSTADFNDSATYKAIVGDFEAVKFSQLLNDPLVGVALPKQLAVSKEICFTFIQALRDVISEFQANRTNPLLTLLRNKSGAIDPAAIAPISAMVGNLNSSIEGLPDVQSVRSDILGTIKDAAGEAYSPSSLSIKSDLPQEADRLFQSLKLFVGESEDGHEGAIHELSLGGANLIFLTLKLLEFKYQKGRETVANFLLIEEPEAHIHTHIQKTLFDRIQYADTQIIYSTHSTQISEVSNVEKMNILGKEGGHIEVFQPAADLKPEEIGSVQRYLDAVRCNLLFARSVVLVEGDAEELLIPVLAKKVLGVSLDELGISLINIRSTGFQNVALLFHDKRIRKRCAILTDLDTAFIDITVNAGDPVEVEKRKQKARAAEGSGAARKTSLDAFTKGNSWIQVCYAPHTFEVDFVAAGNAQLLANVVNEVYTDTGTRATSKAELTSGDIAQFGTRVLTMAKATGKGWFAILLSEHVDANTPIPEYILKALLFAQGQPTPATWAKIIRHRVEQLERASKLGSAEAALVRAGASAYARGKTDLNSLKALFSKHCADDQLNNVLAML